jgi:2-polyprenyl-3-methyl-5-hydroxy-6-metoxy-1,4-benzoquinol methylase
MRYPGSIEMRKIILDKLHKLSIHYFNGTDPNVMRTFEYPWIVEKSHPFKGGVFLDIGAGITPLPLYLAEQGGKVITVDYHPKIRTAEKALEDGNPWGFLDYSEVHSNISSFNQDILHTEFENGSFDCIYSVSVIEHMPRHIRREVWNKVSHWLRPGGALLLTVDLVPNTEDLWNLAENIQVDPEGEHGSITSISDELAKNGLRLVSCDFLRGIQGSRVDCAFLHIEK